MLYNILLVKYFLLLFIIYYPSQWVFFSLNLIFFVSFIRNDQFGIPYTVILNEDTLQEGTVSIRKRDTEVQV